MCVIFPCRFSNRPIRTQDVLYYRSLYFVQVYSHLNPLMLAPRDWNHHNRRLTNLVRSRTFQRLAKQADLNPLTQRRLFGTRKEFEATKVKPTYKKMRSGRTTNKADIQMFRELLESKAITNFKHHNIAINLEPLVLQAVSRAFTVEASSGTTKEINNALASHLIPDPQRMLVATGLGCSTFSSMVLSNNVAGLRGGVQWVPTLEPNTTRCGQTPGGLAKHPGIVIIFWDRSTATGFFIFDGKKSRSCSRRRSPSQAANYPTYVLTGRMSDWNRGKFHHKINHICSFHNVGTSNFWELNQKGIGC